MSDRRDIDGGRGSAAVGDFLNKIAATPRAPGGTGQGRLLFALDATASRERTWDLASRLQAEMFAAARDIGGLALKLCYYRGLGEFHASDWRRDADGLLDEMTGVRCRAGQTQIARVLRQAVEEARGGRLDALVFVGDCMEEDLDGLLSRAGELALRRVPAFLFLEGQDPLAERAFAHIARITHGACCPFDRGSAQQLRELLGAVAAYAAGGRAALERLDGDGARRLLAQLPPR